MTEQVAQLKWNAAPVDFSTIMISVNGTNVQNISYLTGSALLNISDYPPDTTIDIKAYGVNQCSMVSDSTTLTIGKDYKL